MPSEPSTRLWIVGKDLGKEDAWEFQGVFDTEAAAILACRTDDYFIGPAQLNEALPDNSELWDGAYYPRLEPRPEGDPDALDPDA